MEWVSKCFFSGSISPPLPWAIKRVVVSFDGMEMNGTDNTVEENSSIFSVIQMH